MIAELHFAFWQQLFTAGQDARLWQPHLHAVFPGIPTTASIQIVRSHAYQNLTHIRRLRNRIAHHEPIFSQPLYDDFRMLRQMIGWRSAAALAWLDKIQTVTGLLGRKP